MDSRELKELEFSMAKIGLSGEQSDYAENNPKSGSYIKNREFYKEKVFDINDGEHFSFSTEMEVSEGVFAVLGYEYVFMEGFFPTKEDLVGGDIEIVGPMGRVTDKNIQMQDVDDMFSDIYGTVYIKAGLSIPICEESVADDFSLFKEEQGEMTFSMYYGSFLESGAISGRYGMLFLKRIAVTNADSIDIPSNYLQEDGTMFSFYMNKYIYNKMDESFLPADMTSFMATANSSRNVVTIPCESLRSAVIYEICFSNWTSAQLSVTVKLGLFQQNKTFTIGANSCYNVLLPLMRYDTSDNVVITVENIPSNGSVYICGRMYDADNSLVIE